MGRGGAPAQATIVVRLETKPEARVFVDGRAHGSTPVEIRLPRGDGPVSIELRRDGFVSLTQEIVPDRDHRLLVTLAPTPSARSTKRDRPKKGDRRNPAPTQDFRRFN